MLGFPWLHWDLSRWPNFQPQGQLYSAKPVSTWRTADGSVVELNTDTEITVSLNDSSRDQSALGEAFFTVASDSERPFTVFVAGATVRAVGTAFNIFRSSEQSAIVSVTEGIVRVEEAGGSSVSTAQSQLLTVDEAIVIDSVRGLSQSDAQNDEPPPGVETSCYLITQRFPMRLKCLIAIFTKGDRCR